MEHCNSATQDSADLPSNARTGNRMQRQETAKRITQAPRYILQYDQTFSGKTEPRLVQASKQKCSKECKSRGETKTIQGTKPTWTWSPRRTFPDSGAAAGAPADRTSCGVATARSCRMTLEGGSAATPSATVAGVMLSRRPHTRPPDGPTCDVAHSSSQKFNTAQHYHSFTRKSNSS